MSTVQWTTTKYELKLKVKLNWKKYTEGNLILPPTELGQCKDWRFAVNEEEEEAIFTACWDKRRGGDIPLKDLAKKILPYTKNID